jgi:dCTP deaminase
LIIRGSQLADWITADPAGKPDPLVVCPLPEIEKLRRSSDASLDLHLGTWFAKKKARNSPVIDFYEADEKRSGNLASTYYVPFGKDFILHPHNFVLAVTLEWIRMPGHMAAYITGRSSWGRHGLIIETAPGVHPGFTGCLTLEMANVGDVPIKIRPGTRICQLFFHETTPLKDDEKQGSMIGRRQPFAPAIVRDEFEKRLTTPR